MNLHQSITNAIYGMACADSCGNVFEFEEKINPEDVIDYANNSTVLVITDDTQMSLFGFEAIDNFNFYSGALSDKIKKSFTRSYIDWYYTQTHSNHEIPKDAIGLREYASVYSLQAPGNTCMSACYTLKNGGRVKNNSLGCGSVMRLLPLVCLFDFEKYNLEYAEIVLCAKITGGITHKHIANDDAIETYMHTAYKIINGLEVDSVKANHIADIGEGWTAPQAVDMAIWAYCNAQSFDDLLRLSIAHSGDSDSVAAIAGSLWGLSGREVPQKYIDKLDAKDAIKYIIENTYTAASNDYI